MHSLSREGSWGLAHRITVWQKWNLAGSTEHLADVVIIASWRRFLRSRERVYSNTSVKHKSKVCMRSQQPETQAGNSAAGQSVRTSQGLHHQHETSVPGLGVRKTEPWTWQDRALDLVGLKGTGGPPRMRLTQEQVSNPASYIDCNVCHDADIKKTPPTPFLFQWGMSGQEEIVYTESLNKLLNFPSWIYYWSWELELV